MVFKSDATYKSTSRCRQALGGCHRHSPSFPPETCWQCVSLATGSPGFSFTNKPRKANEDRGFGRPRDCDLRPS